MRAIISLPQHPFAERRHSRRRSARHEAPAPEATLPAREVAPVAHGPADPAVQRVRDAGGPIDRASYTCTCGYVFLAPVSTTVECPHCSGAQAW